MKFVIPFDRLSKGGPYVGPRGGLWADPKHTIHWSPAKQQGKISPEFVAADQIPQDELEKIIAKLLKLDMGPLNKLKREIDFRKRNLSGKGEKLPSSLFRWGRAVETAIKRKELKEDPPKEPKKAKPKLKVEPKKAEPKLVITPPEAKPKADKDLLVPAKLTSKSVVQLFKDGDARAAEAAKLFIDNADTSRAKTTRKNSLRKQGLVYSKGEWRMTEKAVEKPAKSKPKTVQTKAKSKPKEKKEPAKKRKPKERKPVAGEMKLEAVGEHVWGSRKDLAELSKKIREGGADLSQEDLATMSYSDAAYLVTKKNLIPAWDMDVLKGFGQEPGAAHLSLSLLAAIRAKPEDSAEARERYRSDIRTLLGGLKDCKTTKDVEGLLQEMWIAHRKSGDWDNVKTIDREQSGWHAAASKEVDRLTKETGIKHLLLRNRASGETYIGKRQFSDYEQFGKKFVGITREPHRSKVWRAARAEADAANKAEDGWKWLEERGGAVTDKKLADRRKAALKRTIATGETKRGWSEAKVWQAIDPLGTGVIKREGQTVEVKDADPKRVRNTFNLKEVDYGKEGYMTQADREYHTMQFEGAMHDFSEVLGLSPDILSLNGRLAVAFGARGKGAAKAHYEPNNKVINITKYRGGGSLSHEWGHALDNVMADVYVGKSTKASGNFLTDSADNPNLPPKIASAVKDVLASIDKARDPAKARQNHKKHKEHLIAKNKEHTIKYNEVTKDLKYLKQRPTSEEELVKRVNMRKNQIKKWKAELKELKAKKDSHKNQMEIGNREYWTKQYAEEIDDMQSKGPLTKIEEDDMSKLAIAQMVARRDINATAKAFKNLSKADPEMSDYARSAAMMGAYMSDPQEKFARAFESFVQDELSASKRKSDYLTGGKKTEMEYDTGMPLWGSGTAQPYPQGDERKAINKAMRNLVEVLKETGSIEKAMRFIISLEKAKSQVAA